MSAEDPQEQMARERGLGNSSIVGIGGDPVPGSSFIDVITLFEQDPETDVSGSKGTAAAKAEALEACGVKVGRTPTEVAEIATELAKAAVP